MPKPISNEVREKIIQHKKNGEKEIDIARWLLITKSSVGRIWGEYKRNENYLLKYENCGRKSVISSELECKILNKIKEIPDITLLEIIENLELKITESGLSKWLKKRGYSFKKKTLIPKNKIVKKSKKNAKNF
jgi:transposase